MKKTIVTSIAALAGIGQAQAVEFEALGKSVATTLGTTKAFKKSTRIQKEKVDIFYSKGPSGSAERFAVIQKGIYEPNCTHTWVIGVDGKSGKVSQVRVVEMSCPHAFPTRAASFLDQYKGKGPADVAKLDSDIRSVAKATGSAELTTKAVKTAIQAVGKLKKEL